MSSLSDSPGATAQGHWALGPPMTSTSVSYSGPLPNTPPPPLPSASFSTGITASTVSAGTD